MVFVAHATKARHTEKQNGMRIIFFFKDNFSINILSKNSECMSSVRSYAEAWEREKLLRDSLLAIHKTPHGVTTNINLNQKICHMKSLIGIHVA